MTLSRSHGVKVVVDPTVPAALTSCTHDIVEIGKQLRLGVKMVRPCSLALLGVSEAVGVVAAVVGHNVVHVARLSVDGEVSRAGPAIHPLDESTGHLVGSVAVARSEVDVSLVDTLSQEGVLAEGTVDGPEIASVLDAVSQSIGCQHTLIAGPVPDDAVERMPRRVLDHTVDPMSLKIGIGFGSDAVRDLLVVGAVPTGGWVEDVFVWVEVVRCALVVTLDDVDKDKLGIVCLSRACVVSCVDVGCVAVV